MKMRITLDGIAHEVDAEPTAGGVRVTVNGVTYHLDVEVQEPHAAAAPHSPATKPMHEPLPVQSLPSPGPVGGNHVIAPMAGVIKQILVKAQQTITLNQAVIVMEAMKMETTIYAPAAGVVQAIRCHIGDAVQSDQLLIEVG